MSHPSNRFVRHPQVDGIESLDRQTPDTALTMVVQDLENDELQALLVVLLREWRERVAVASLNNSAPPHLNA